MHLLTGTHARAAVATGLGIALVLGGICADPSAAFAENAQGSITIKQQHNAQATYHAYQLFDADVANDDTATHVKWPSDTMQDLIVGFARQEGYAEWLAEKDLDETQAQQAQNALEFIAEGIRTSGANDETEGSLPIPAGESFAARLARYLIDHQAPHDEAVADTPFTGNEGYWLFITDSEGLKEPDVAATAPLWIALGGSLSEVWEKSSIPTLTKQVQEDSSTSWGATADAHVGQRVPYQLTGTLPANFHAFNQYHYQFVDQLSAGLDIAIPEGKTIADVVTVTVGDKEVAVDDINLKVTLTDKTLTVEFVDLASSFWESYHLDGHSIIRVDYQAQLTPDAQIGSTGNDNTATLLYTNDPVTNGEGKTTSPPPPRLFAYALTLKKVDEQTNVALPGAGFTIQVDARNADEASRGQYVQADGSLAKTAYEFVTGSDGTFSVRGIDEGIYTIAEVTTPAGYDAIDEDITLEIASTLNDDTIALDDIQAEVTGGDRKDAGATSQTGAIDLNASSGIVSINVTNDKALALPLTGMAGVGGPLGAAAATVTGSLLLLRRHRRW